MALRDAFVTRIRQENVVPADVQQDGVAAAPAPQPQAVGAFVSVQSLLSFPVAAMVVGVIGKVLGKIAGLSDKHGASVAALIVGATILAINLTDSQARPRTPGDWVKAILIALLNCLLLLSSALGIGVLTSP